MVMDILHWSQVFVFCSMEGAAHVFYWEDDVLGGRIGRGFTVPTCTYRTRYTDITKKTKKRGKRCSVL